MSASICLHQYLASFKGRHAYSLLEQGHFFVGQGVGLGDDRNQVDLGVQPAHDFDIQRLQRVACRLNKVDTGMNSVVDNIHSVDLVLRLEVCIVSLLNIFHNWPP